MASPANPPVLKIDAKLEGPTSSYTDFVVELLKKWPPKRQNELQPTDQLVQIRCLSLPEDPFYIGIEQTMEIKSDFKTVLALMDDYNDYAKLFPGFKSVSALPVQENLSILSWEEIVPLFFISNVHYDMSYLRVQARPSLIFYRYQLIKSDRLLKSDGAIVLEEAGPNRILYHEWDFYLADWGSLKTFAPSRIWSDSLKGVLLSDLSLKFKAENPDWSYDKVHDADDVAFDHFPVKKIIENKIAFRKDLWLP